MDNIKKRESGVLLHISSLPSNYGIGSLGKEAYAFVDWLKSANFKLWQILPLVPTGYGDSPYQSVSSMALNYYFIDLDILMEKKLLTKEDIEGFNIYINEKYVSFENVFYTRIDILRKAFSNFDVEEEAFKKFIEKADYKDFALFMTLKAKHDYQAWTTWPKKYQKYSKAIETQLLEKNINEVLFWQWTQYEFINQWNPLRKYANDNGIELIGDMPLYVAYDSVEVWKTPKLFLLEPDLTPKFVAGCPPDAFSDDGQLWGNPVYDWAYHKKQKYSWWTKRINHSFQFCDRVRIDHFRGFDRYYSIPYGNTNAKIGEWVDGPKFDLFKSMLDMKIIAEDLGVIDDGVIELMNQTGYPGMKILEFAFDGNPNNEHKPSVFSSNNVVYTGTHDNQPLLEYINELSEDAIDTYISDLLTEAKKLNVDAVTDTNEDLVKSAIKIAIASGANTCVLPMQDLLTQGKYTRMNLPSTLSTDNWSYRVEKRLLTPELAQYYKELNIRYNR